MVMCIVDCFSCLCIGSHHPVRYVTSVAVPRWMNKMDGHVPNFPDWSDYSPSLSFLNMANRTSTAASIKYPSALDYSRSLLFSRYNMMDYQDSMEEPEPSDSYNLSSFLESDAVNNDGEEMNTHTNICKWVEAKVFPYIGREDRNKLRVLSEKALDHIHQSLPPLETSLNKRPDVGIFVYIRGKLFLLLQIEVDSGGYQSTCIKLAQGVGDQLMWQRNCNDEITTCAGMYFPTFIRGTCVVKIQLQWKDEKLVFFLTRTLVSLEGLQEVVANAVKFELSKIRSLCNNSSGHRHVVPLSRTFVMSGRFGANAHQVESGESIVIANSQARKVWKYPLLGAYRERLLELLVGESLFTRFLIPEKKVGKYFEYKLLKPPIPVEQAKSKVMYITSGVILALNELHSFGLAHLDIRLENVCFDHDNTVVLIDLDRSLNVDDTVTSMLSRPSLMYPFVRGWTYRHWDWRQLGLMVAHIESPGNKDEYHSVIPDFNVSLLNHEFLKKLFNDGKGGRCTYVLLLVLSSSCLSQVLWMIPCFRLG